MAMPERAAGLVAIARSLPARGANPNAEYNWNWHRELPRTALWGALCAGRHLPLAEALLEGGTNPTDGVSTHIAAGIGDLAALELLHRDGFTVLHRAAMGGRAEAVRVLLAHGASVNALGGMFAATPLVWAAEGWSHGSQRGTVK